LGILRGTYLNHMDRENVGGNKMEREGRKGVNEKTLGGGRS